MENETRKKLFIDGKRSGYAPCQCGETLTVKGLIKLLSSAIKYGDLDANSPIYLANDNGYTFGPVNDYNSFMVGQTYEDAEDLDYSADPKDLYVDQEED